MATTRWRATGGNTAYTTDGNWSGSHPGTGDIGIADGDSNNNIDGVDDSATLIDEFRVLPAYTGTIGSEGTSLGLSANNSTTNKVTFAGSGPAYISGGDGTGTPAQLIATLDVQQAPGGFWLSGGVVTTMHVTSGRVNIGASATITTLNVMGGEVTIAAGATITTINHIGGTIIDEAGATTVNHASGRFVAREDAAYTTVNNYGGEFNHQSGGTLATMNLFAGKLTPNGATDNVTITNLNRYAGSVFVRSAAGVTVTVTTEAEIGDTSRDQTTI